jgi:hypothetical protein
VTAEEYEALPEEIARAIAIVDGYIAYCEAPVPDHQTVGRRLANALEIHARSAMDRGHEYLTVNNGVDLRLWDVPLLNRARRRALPVSGPRPRRTAPSEARLARDRDRLSRIGNPGHDRQTWGVRQSGHPALYKNVGIFMKDEGGDPPSLSNPIPMTIDWSALEF